MPTEGNEKAPRRLARVPARAGGRGTHGRAGEGSGQMQKAAKAWHDDLDIQIRAAASALDEWITQSKMTQNGFARLVDELLPEEVGNRGVTGPTVSRYRNTPGQLMKASLAAWLTMIHATGHRVTTAAQRMQDAVEAAQARAQAGRDPEALQAVMERQAERRRSIARATALLDTLTDRQVMDISVIMEAYAGQNLKLRAQLAATQGTPLSVDVPNMEARAAGAAALEELGTYMAQVRAAADATGMEAK